jgi:hypothetical protein
VIAPLVEIASVVHRHWVEWRTVDDVADETVVISPPRESAADAIYRDLEDAASWP